MSLQEKLDAVKADFISKVPAELRAVMDKVTDGLIESGQADRALKVGDRAPTFELPDPDGNIVTSAELLRKGPLVLTFYRGVWCPYCNLDLQALEEAAAEIRATGASLVAISQQTAPNSRKSQRDNKLSFPILGDKGGELADDFGIRWKSPEELQSVYKLVGVDLAAFNGEGSWTLPMPARYVIDRDGTIVYSEVNADYTHRPEPSDLLPVLRKLAMALAD
jgi:peroxiredoxin